MKLGICKLCREEKNLISKSHIIPKFMYNGMFDEGHSALKVSRTAFYKWREADDKLREIIEEQKEANIDFAESQLRKLISGYTSG